MAFDFSKIPMLPYANFSSCLLWLEHGIYPMDPKYSPILYRNLPQKKNQDAEDILYHALIEGKLQGTALDAIAICCSRKNLKHAKREVNKVSKQHPDSELWIYGNFLDETEFSNHLDTTQIWDWNYSPAYAIYNFDSERKIISARNWENVGYFSPTQDFLLCDELPNVGVYKGYTSILFHSEDLIKINPFSIISPNKDTEYTTPYIELMRQAIEENKISVSNQGKIESLTEWFVERLSSIHPGEGVQTKARYLATFIRQVESAKVARRPRKNID